MTLTTTFSIVLNACACSVPLSSLILDAMPLMLLFCKHSGQRSSCERMAVAAAIARCDGRCCSLPSPASIRSDLTAHAQFDCWPWKV